MNISFNEDYQRQLLRVSKVIAVVGYSPDPSRTSHQIAHYLKRAGYRVYAVNPMVETIDGQPSYARLADVPEAIDIVNVFRRAIYLPGVADESVRIGAKAIWAQVGVEHAVAEQIAEANRTLIVMNVCIKVAHRHLLG